MERLSPLPDIGEVPGPASWHDEQGIDPHVITVAHVAGGQPLGGGHHAAQAPLVECEGGSSFGRAGFHFDERQRAPPPGDDVDFAARDTRPASEDAPSVKPQEPAGQRLSASTALLCLLTIHWLRSRARA